jgi:hypothetical protein
MIPSLDTYFFYSLLLQYILLGCFLIVIPSLRQVENCLRYLKREGGAQIQQKGYVRGFRSILCLRPTAYSII